MSTRVEKVVEQLAERELDALLITGLVNVRWLTGFTGSSGAAVVQRDGVLRFLTDFRYLTQSADEVAPAFEREIGQDLLELAVTRLPLGVLGFDDALMSVKEHARLERLLPEGVELAPAGGLIEELRYIKDADELDKLRAAATLADAALTDVLTRGLAGRTELDVAVDLEFTMRKLGAQGASFPPIVAAGTHGALPHASPRAVEIPRDTLVVVDWGAVLDGYASDCTRTFATGELDPRDRAIYDKVLEAQEAALAAVRPGLTGREVDAVARSVIDAAGHAEHFGHGLGHGVGLEIHEGPRLSKQGEVVLLPGMVVTVEPGIYVPGAVGVRIEDLVAVTDDGHEVLNGLTKALQVVGAATA
ncbi:MAG: aminopeptidase family protein [Solirubrobacterales bacterium]|nr:aminopeptidase family protein [Solirubrobacterales bacterium]